MNLGMMPPDLEFPTVEVWKALPVSEEAVAGRMVTHASDAHQLGAILEAEFDLPTSRFSVGGLFEAILHGNHD